MVKNAKSNTIEIANNASNNYVNLHLIKREIAKNSLNGRVAFYHLCSPTINVHELHRVIKK